MTSIRSDRYGTIREYSCETVCKHKNANEALLEEAVLHIACEYSRLSFASATTCETHLVAEANERQLYSQAILHKKLKLNEDYTGEKSGSLLLQKNSQ